MSKLVVPVLFLVAAYVLFFGYLIETYPELPAKIASHFDFRGNPDGWMSRLSDAEIASAVALLVPGIVVGAMAGASRIPVSFLNRPHRDFWLAPERRQSAQSALLRYALWFAALNVLFLTALQALTVEANARAPSHFDTARLELLAVFYLVATAFWTFLLLRRFSRLA
jgi:hypothetical protein